MNGKVKKALTFPEQCAVQLKGVDDILDRLYQDLTIRLRQVGFALHPKWQQHELVREDGATRYIMRDIADQHGQCSDRSAIWLDFSVMPGDEPNVAVCSVQFQLERYADGDAALSSIPRVRLQRMRDIVWPDGDASVWKFAADVSAKRAELIEEFCQDVLKEISP